MTEGSLPKEYVVLWGDSPAESETTSSTTYTARNLQSNTAYDFTITAKNEAGNGEASDSRTFHTGKLCCSVAVVHIYPLVTGQRQTQLVG